MDRIDALRTLIAAVDGGTLTAASRALKLPLPTVSRRVSDLEAHLGVQLVVRTARKLMLTEIGERFVPAARRILSDLDEAERAASGEYLVPRGELLVTAPIAFGRLHVLPLVLAFLRAYPEVNIRLVLSDTVVDLVENRVDVALRLGPLPDSALVALRLGHVRWITVASRTYLARRGTPSRPADLVGHDCLAFEGLQTLRTWVFGPGSGNGPVTIRPRLGVNTADALVEAVTSGLGIARMTSYQAAAAIREGGVVRILRDYEPEPIPVHLVHAGLPLLPLKLRAFLDFAAPVLRRDLGALPTELRR